MPKFDFITSREFREALEADDAEMRRAFEAQAWKSSQVLSGSIVEALLVDYLQSTPTATSGADPLKLDLGQAIELCRKDNSLSERTANLCAVIKSYRNLIHPGRMVRLSEPPPDKGSASIALALVDMIVDEQARARRANVGLTGEQIVSKLIRDSNALAILTHLLTEVNDQQRERLLLELIPQAYMDVLASDQEAFSDTDERLREAFRIIFDSSNKPLQTKCVLQFVKVLKESDGPHVTRYGTAFFHCSDLALIAPPQRDMVIEHLLGTAPPVHTKESLKRVIGLAAFIKPQQIPEWLDPYLRAIVSSSRDSSVARHQLDWESMKASPSFNEAIDTRIKDWIRFYKEKGNASAVSRMEDLLKDLGDRIPF